MSLFFLLIVLVVLLLVAIWWKPSKQASRSASQASIFSALASSTSPTTDRDAVLEDEIREIVEVIR